MKRIRIDWIDYQAVGSTVESFVSDSQSELNRWEIHFNDFIDEAEAWFVIEGSHEMQQQANIPEGMLFFGSGDTIWKPSFYNESPWRLEFLKQFDHIYSCHDIALANAQKAMPFHHWMVNANTGTHKISKHFRDYDFLSSLEPPRKTRDISVICSTKAFTPEHRLRLKFVEELKNHFGDRLDWYGNGRQPIDEKWDALIDYRYSIAIENQVRANVITEKILDPYLTYTLPIYHGAPNIQDYFASDSYMLIDIANFAESVDKIERLLEAESYSNHIETLSKERMKVLNDFNFIQRIVKIVEHQASLQSLELRKKRVIAPMKNFQPWDAKARDYLAGTLFKLRSHFS
jgi:hypothetical protein